MQKFSKRLLCLLLAAYLLGMPLCSAAAAPPEVAVPSAILVDAATGTVLASQNAEERRAPASVTKIMTMLLVLEALERGQISWDDTVVTSAAAAAKGGSQVYLKEGEAMPLRDMLKSVAVASANDCACALAEHVAGSEEAFVNLMNQRAAELGMADTHFVNCTGLDDDPAASEHLTTAADIAKMSRELLSHQEIREFTTIWMDTVRDGQFGLSNTNKLVRFYSGCTGLKTGFTSAAGYCVSASAARDGLELIAVIMGGASSADRFTSAKQLLDFGFANYALLTPEIGTLEPLRVVLGRAPTVALVPADSTPLLIEKQLSGAVQTEIVLEESVEAPVAQGQQLGLCTITADGQTLAEIPIVAATEIPRLRTWDLFLRMLKSVCFGQNPSL